MITYNSDGHIYIDESDNKWTSVTDLIKRFEQPFNELEVAQKTSKNRKSKWYKIPVNEILNAWKEEKERAVELGNWYHEQREKETLQLNSLNRENVDLQIYHPIVDEKGCKIAPDQKLLEGVYPEHFIYLSSYNLCGQADRVEVVGDTVNIYDYKSNKEIKMHSFTSWSGKVTRMLSPVSHLEDCNYYHYALQLSMYMYIILKHNPQYTPGKLVIQHVIFEAVGEDKYGYPIYKRDSEGNPIVKEVVHYNVPYLFQEVKDILKSIKS